MSKNNEMEVINSGKMPKKITSVGNTKDITKSFKVTPAQNEQIKTEMKMGNYRFFTDFVLNKIFNGIPTITIEGGRDLLQKLSECADLFNAIGDSTDNKEEYGKLAKKFSEIELSISQIFDYIDVIKNKLIGDKEGG